MSHEPGTAPGNAQSGTFGLGISGDGAAVTFASLASDLDPRDTDAELDVYVARGGQAPVLVSARADGVKGNGISTRPEISADGRFVAFMSGSTNLDPRADDGLVHVYVKDLDLGQLVLASTASDGTGANGSSSLPVLSGDGRFLAFISRADNLDPADTDRLPDAYVKDLRTGAVRLVSVSTGGVKARSGAFGIGSVAISGDGTHVAFSTDAPGLDADDADETPDVFVKDWLSGELVAVTPGEGRGGSTAPSLSWSGHQVAFETYRRDLHPLDDDEESSVYVRDLDSGALTLASVLPDGRGAGYRATQPSLSADGGTVAFAGEAPDLIPAQGPGPLRVYVRDVRSPQVVLASVDETGIPAAHLALDPALAGDAGSVAFATPAALVARDQNQVADVYRVQLAGGHEPPLEPTLTAAVTRSELAIADAPHVLVTVDVSVSSPAGVSEVVTRLLDPSGVVRGLTRSVYQGDTSVVRTDNLLLPAQDLVESPGEWLVRVRVLDVEGGGTTTTRVVAH